MSKKSSSSGVSVLGVLLIVFVVLKLTGLVSWRWGWVLLPLWVMLCLIFLGMFVIIVGNWEDIKK